MTIEIKAEKMYSGYLPLYLKQEIDNEDKALQLYEQKLRDLRWLYSCGYIESYTITLYKDEVKIKKRSNFRINSARFRSKKYYKEG